MLVPPHPLSYYRAGNHATIPWSHTAPHIPPVELEPAMRDQWYVPAIPLIKISFPLLPGWICSQIYRMSLISFEKCLTHFLSNIHKDYRVWMNKSIWGNTVRHSFNKKPAGKNHSEKLLWQFAINTCMCLNTCIHSFMYMPNFQYAPQFWITVLYC